MHQISTPTQILVIIAVVGSSLVSFLVERLRSSPRITRTDTVWESKTPSNARELWSRSTLIRNRMQRHQDPLTMSIIATVNQLKKGAEVMVHSAVLLHYWIASLERANKAATKREQRKKKRI